MAVLSDTSRAEILRLGAEFPDAQSALLPALALAQHDYGGWLPGQALDEVATVMGLPSTLVASVATFYTLLNRQPVGRHLVQVCTNLSCSLLGAEHIVELLSQKLGIPPGQTTPDGRFALLEVECLGACGAAPVMQVDDRYYENLNEDKINRILAAFA